MDWTRPFRRIVIAWDDGEASLRAVRAAMPFLARAERVDIAMVDPTRTPSDLRNPGSALSQWLDRNGIRAELSVLPRMRQPVGTVLAGFARDKGADALVMGAYGHSRLREAVLGGVTREMLGQVPLPLIIAH